MIRIIDVNNLRAVIILRVVDEDSSFSLYVAGLEVVHHPKAVVEETLVVVVEIVVEGLTVVDSSVCVTCLSLRVCPHIRKPDIMCVFLGAIICLALTFLVARPAQLD